MRLRRLALAAAVALVVAACAKQQAQPGHAGPESTTHGSLAACLDERGVRGADDQAIVLGPPADVGRDVWEAAMRACSTLGPGPTGP